MHSQNRDRKDPGQCKNGQSILKNCNKGVHTRELLLLVPELVDGGEFIPSESAV